jgi:hypothetical protein
VAEAPPVALPEAGEAADTVALPADLPPATVIRVLLTESFPTVLMEVVARPAPVSTAPAPGDPTMVDRPPLFAFCSVLTDIALLFTQDGPLVDLATGVVLGAGVDVRFAQDAVPLGLAVGVPAGAAAELRFAQDGVLLPLGVLVPAGFNDVRFVQDGEVEADFEAAFEAAAASRGLFGEEVAAPRGLFCENPGLMLFVNS